MRKFRVAVNLFAFVALTIGLLVYGLVDLWGNPLATPTLVSATFPDASGISQNFGVVLDGVVVGSVQSVKLVPSGARVVMSIQPNANVPADVRARIGLANDLGEQQVELVLDHRGPAPSLRNGAVIPAISNGVPTEVGQVIDTTTRLLHSIGVHQLNSLLATLAQALSGRAGDLQSMLVTSRQFSSEFLAYEHQFEALLAASPPVLNGLASNGAQLRQDLANTEVLANLLEHHRYDLVSLLEKGSNAANLLTQLVTANRPDLACMLHDFADVSANTARPLNLANLSIGLATNQWFFAAIAGVSPTGPSKSLYPGDPYKVDQVWLRTRLLLPPGQPPAEQYSHGIPLPPSKPGAACDTEFGRGVRAASQSEPQIGVPGGMATSSPTTSEAQVRGGADPKSSAQRMQPTSYDATAVSHPAGLGASAGLVAGLLLAASILVPRRRKWEGRDEPCRRRRRRRPGAAPRRTSREGNER